MLIPSFCGEGMRYAFFSWSWTFKWSSISYMKEFRFSNLRSYCCRSVCFLLLNVEVNDSAILQYTNRCAIPTDTKITAAIATRAGNACNFGKCYWKKFCKIIMYILPSKPCMISWCWLLLFPHVFINDPAFETDTLNLTGPINNSTPSFWNLPILL